MVWKSDWVWSLVRFVGLSVSESGEEGEENGGCHEVAESVRVDGAVEDEGD